jgi:hypothetical protein
MAKYVLGSSDDTMRTKMMHRLQIVYRQTHIYDRLNRLHNLEFARANLLQVLYVCLIS